MLNEENSVILDIIFVWRSEKNSCDPLIIKILVPYVNVYSSVTLLRDCKDIR